MITVKLIDEGIYIYLPPEWSFDDTPEGKWLAENNIHYKIVTCDMITVIDDEGSFTDATVIERISFNDEEDLIAFKLRWS